MPQNTNALKAIIPTHIQQQHVSLNKKYATHLKDGGHQFSRFSPAVQEREQQEKNRYVHALRVYQKYHICFSPNVVKVHEARWAVLTYHHNLKPKKQKPY